MRIARGEERNFKTISPDVKATANRPVWNQLHECREFSPLRPARTHLNPVKNPRPRYVTCFIHF